MKSQQSDAKNHPLTVHIDNNQMNVDQDHQQASHPSSLNKQQQQQTHHQRDSCNNNIYHSPVNKLHQHQHHSHSHQQSNKSHTNNALDERKLKSPELPPHLRYEQQQLLSPIASSGNTLTGSVTGAIDSDYDLPPEERQILSLSHSPSPAYQPHLNQLTRLNYYQSTQQQQQPCSIEYQNLVKPKVQPAPVSRGLQSDLSNNKTGGTSILQSMNQATLANSIEPTSHRLTAPKMAFHNQHYNQHTNTSCPVASDAAVTSNLYEFNNQQQQLQPPRQQQQQQQVKDHLYTYESTRSSHPSHPRQQQQQQQQQLNHFQSPIRGKLIVGETLPSNSSSSSIYSVPKVNKVSSYTTTKVDPVKLSTIKTPSNNNNNKMTDREQKELDQLLSDMYQELATFPNYNTTTRSTGRSLSTSNQPTNIYNNNNNTGKLFTRSISHSPSVRNKPQVLHYKVNRVTDDYTSQDTVDSGSVYATLANTNKNLSTQPSINEPIHSNCLPSSPSVFDGDSRGMSIRSVTLTPTPVRPLYATQHSLVTSTPKQIVVTDTSTKNIGQSNNNSFKGTHIIPGAKIGDQDAMNRVGVYASTLGKKKLSSNERQELDDLINVMMEEVRNFPDYSSTKHFTDNKEESTTFNQLGYHNGSISNLEQVGIETSPTPGVASTRAVFENVTHSTHQQVNRSPSPTNRSRQSHFHSGRQSDREKSYFSSGPTRTASISPIRQFNRGNSVVSSRSISTGRYPDRASIGTNATVITNRAPSAASLLTASLNPPYGTAGGVLAQPSTEPLPPHLLTRPTEWCKDERSRPYHARADSRPFTYGVTSASPLIQRRRVHSESTAYVVENRPRAQPDVDYNEPRRPVNNRPSIPSNNSHTYSAGYTRGRVKSPNSSSITGGNIYDDPSELEREMDAISEVSVNSGGTLTGMKSHVDMATSPVSWLEKQQIKLKEKKDVNDITYQEQKGKSKAMLSELTRTMSGSRVPGYDEEDNDTSPVNVSLRPPSPPKSKLIERLNMVNGSNKSKQIDNHNDNNYNYSTSINDHYNDKCISPILTSTNYTRASSPTKGKSVTLLTENGDIVDTEGRPATPGRPNSQQSSSLHHALTTFASGPTPRLSSPTRYASYLHNNNGHDHSSSHDASYSRENVEKPTSPIYASVNLNDKHRTTSMNQEDK